MKTHYTVTLAMLTGFGLGAVAIEGLHAQAKPPVYQIVEIDMLNQEAYLKENHRNRALSFNIGIVSKKSRLTAIQRPSRTSCRSATS